MKLSNVTAKLTSMKSGAVRVLAAATLAGAVLTAAAPAAEAQQFAVGVRIGGPRYFGPAPRPIAVEPPGFYGPRVAYGPGFYGPRYDGWRAHEAFVRHEDFRFHHDYGYGRR